MSGSSLDRNVACHTLCADNLCARSELTTDVINEATPGSGVTIDGLLIKDGSLLLTPPRVEMYINDNATPTAVASAGAWYVVTGTSTNSVPHPLFTHSGNRLTYTGTTRIFLFGQMCLSGAPVAGTNRFVLYGIAKNGTVVTASTIMRRHNNPSPDVGAVSLNFMLTLTNGEYIEPVIQNRYHTDDITISYLNLAFMVPPSMEAADIP